MSENTDTRSPAPDHIKDAASRWVESIHGGEPLDADAWVSLRSWLR